ncbi:MAG: DUF3667 domain-containing protein [Salinibacter sp.]|uniref:DUF3667 domain-containing protein n=1 Tax=Salinibacter sp. TaxID=2065818 RepID=UPI0035D45D8F
MSDSTEEASSRALVKTRTCQNCSRRFVGNYCPNCGQEAAPPDSVLGTLSIFFRELVDIEGGLWPTLWALTARPGHVLARYLNGARQRLMHPGRYLLAAIVVAFGTRQVFTWLGLRNPYGERVSANLSRKEAARVDPETASEIQSLLASTANRVIESQSFLIATNLLLTGLLSLTIWRLFRNHFERGAQAVAFSAFLVAHTTFLETAAKLLYVPVAQVNAGPSADLPISVSVAIAAVYVGVVVPRTFGEGWKSVVKGLLALGWAAFEYVLISGLVIGGYVAWVFRTRLKDENAKEEIEFGLSLGSAGETGAMALEILPAVAIILGPFLLHAALEAYYRLR